MSYDWSRTPPRAVDPYSPGDQLPTSAPAVELIRGGTELVYPFGKLGAITRKRNEIKELMLVRDAVNANRVAELLSELWQKENFVAACRVQESLPDASAFDIEEYVAWRNMHI